MEDRIAEQPESHAPEEEPELLYPTGLEQAILSAMERAAAKKREQRSDHDDEQEVA